MAEQQFLWWRGMYKRPPLVSEQYIKRNEKKTTNNDSHVFMNNRDAEQCQGHFFPLRTRPEVEHLINKA